MNFRSFAEDDPLSSSAEWAWFKAESGHGNSVWASAMNCAPTKNNGVYQQIGGGGLVLW